ARLQGPERQGRRGLRPVRPGRLHQQGRRARRRGPALRLRSDLPRPAEVRWPGPGAAQGAAAAVRRTGARAHRGRVRLLRAVLLRVGPSPQPVSTPSTGPADGFETERLVVRGWHLADVDAFFDLYRRWEVARWLGSTPRALETLDEAEARVTRWAELNRSAEDEGRWAVERREDGRVVGTVLLVRLPDGDGEVEVGWHLH